MTILFKVYSVTACTFFFIINVLQFLKYLLLIWANK